jgi:hypothetical protein
LLWLCLLLLLLLLLMMMCLMLLLLGSVALHRQGQHCWGPQGLA